MLGSLCLSSPSPSPSPRLTLPYLALRNRQVLIYCVDNYYYCRYCILMIRFYIFFSFSRLMEIMMCTTFAFSSRQPEASAAALAQLPLAALGPKAIHPSIHPSQTSLESCVMSSSSGAIFICSGVSFRFRSRGLVHYDNGVEFCCWKREGYVRNVPTELSGYSSLVKASRPIKLMMPDREKGIHKIWNGSCTFFSELWAGRCWVVIEWTARIVFIWPPSESIPLQPFGATMK